MNLIIDFDSTIVLTETLTIMAGIAYRRGRQEGQNDLSAQISAITHEAMNGTMSFHDALVERIALIKPDTAMVDETIVELRQRISTSIEHLQRLIEQHEVNAYIVSGGFKEIIGPVLKGFLTIPDSHIMANEFTADYHVNAGNDLAYDNGKAECVRKLGLVGLTYVIGDGYTDYEIKLLGHADAFIYFGEAVKRKMVMKHADYLLYSFGKLPEALRFLQHQPSKGVAVIG